MPRKPYKISLTKPQQSALDLIGEKGIILFDDTNTVMIDKTYEKLDMRTFNSLEMIGILIIKRKIGRDQYLYKINRNMLAKVL